MKSKEEAIVAFLAAGFPLIPLVGKRPVDESWETTPAGKYDEKTLKGNYGVALGARDLVIDVDPRNYAPKDQPLKRLAQAIGGVPAGTLVVRTGGGGLHVYLKKPADFSCRNALDEYRGVEFKGGPGRQVVGPGSVHPETGQQYHVLQGTAASIAPAPQALLDLIRRSAATFNNEVGTGTYQDDDATRERCAQFLKALPGAIQGLHGDDTTFKAACGLRDRGVSPRVAFELLLNCFNLRCVPPWEDDELAAKVQHAYQYARGAIGNAHPAAHFDKVESAKKESAQSRAEAEAVEGAVGKSGWKLDGRKQPVSCLQNTLNYLSLPTVGLRGCFGYNEFARRVDLIKETPWHASPGLPVTDIDLQRMRAHLARNHGYETGTTNLVDAMVDVAQFRRFHPVKEYLNGLKWDGVRRLDSWLTKYLGVEEDTAGYVAAAGRKTLVAAAARVYEPGCKFDHVLVLEGRQNLGKSGVCKVLGGSWFSDFKMSVGEKDTVQMMQGKWIVEMADLHATRQADIDMVKSFLTRSTDEARFAYGRLPGQYPRQGIFIATYNPVADGTYLKDEENRRWWPVLCNPVPAGGRHFDFEGLKAVRDQLWAEAVELYRKGEALTMDTDQLQDAAKVVQDARRAEHPWSERVGDWIRERDRNSETRADFYTGREVFIGAMAGLDARYSRHEQLAAARALKDLGWTAGYKWKDNGTVRGFWRPGRAAAPAPVAVAVAVAAPKEDDAMAVFGDLA